MHEELFVFGFTSGAQKLVLIAENQEEATSMAFESFAEDSQPFHVLNFCEIDWKERIVKGMVRAETQH